MTAVSWVASLSPSGPYGAAWTVWLTFCAMLATGCGAKHPTSIADRFVRQGRPSIDLGGQVTPGGAAAYVAQLRKLAAEARPRAKAPSAEVAERRDGRLQERLAELQAAPSPERHRDVASEYRRLGIMDAAFSHLSAAIRLDPREAAAYDLRARIWRGWRLAWLGLPDARKAIELAPRSATAWNTLGLLLTESGHAADGIRAYLRAVGLDDRAAYAWNNLCSAWIVRGDAPSAIQACQRAVGLDPALTSAQRNLVAAEHLRSPPAAAAADEVTASR